MAVGDPGFALLTLDEWYDNNAQGQSVTRGGKKHPYIKGPQWRLIKVSAVSNHKNFYHIYFGKIVFASSLGLPWSQQF